MLATLSQVNYSSSLTNRVRDLPTPQFVELLDQITREFEHFLRAIDMINNESLEIMLEQILEAFTLKIGQILEAERTTIFMVDQEKQELWSKIAQGDGERSLEIRVPMGKGISGYVATTVAPLNIPDAYKDDRFDRTHDQKNRLSHPQHTLYAGAQPQNRQHCGGGAAAQQAQRHALQRAG